MSAINGPCARCGNPTVDTPLDRRVSYFNKDLICMSCSDRERTHPLFAAARKPKLRPLKPVTLNFRALAVRQTCICAPGMREFRCRGQAQHSP